MKRKVCIILFGTSFLVAILGEAYLLNAAQPHIFSIIGIGIVVILTGFLFFDSVWEYISSEISKKNSYGKRKHRNIQRSWMKDAQNC